MAAKAGPEPGSGCASGCREVPHVPLQRAGRRTDRPAIDAGRHHGDEEPSVEARVAREPRPPPGKLHRSHTSRYGSLPPSTSRFRTWSPAVNGRTGGVLPEGCDSRLTRVSAITRRVARPLEIRRVNGRHLKHKRRLADVLGGNIFCGAGSRTAPPPVPVSGYDRRF